MKRDSEHAGSAGKRTGVHILRSTLSRRMIAWTSAPRGFRGRLARRTVAALLLTLAGVLALAPNQGVRAAREPVLVAARDLAPGATLAAEDVSVVRLPIDSVPDEALRAERDAKGRLLASAARRGQPLTDVNLVGEALTSLATGGSDHAAVAIRPADPAMARLLHPGRRVDVVTVHSDAAEILARRAPVLAVRHADDERDPLIIVGLGTHKAAEVASATLGGSVTVTLR